MCPSEETAEGPPGRGRLLSDHRIPNSGRGLITLERAA